MYRKPATIRDIARDCGYSHVTVSMVLNNRTDYAVAAATRQRIVETAERLDYVPNLLGRALVSGKTQTVTLWINRLNSSNYARYYAYLQDVVSDSGYHLSLSEGRTSDDPFTSNMRGAQWPTDGIIAVDSPARVDQWIQTRGNLSIPIVSVGPFTSNMVDSVHVDLGSGTKEAIEHLINSGKKRIEYVGERGSVSDEDREIRNRIYSNVLKAIGAEPRYIVAELPSRSSVYAAVTLRLRRMPIPDAIFAHNDMHATAAIRAILDAGYSIPGDIAVVGVDGIEESEYCEPTLSTVVQPVEEAVQLAWRYLRERMASPGGPPKRIVIPTSLIVRNSSRMFLTIGQAANK